MDFIDVARLTIEDIEALPGDPPKADLREATPTGKSGLYRCRANSDRNEEMRCKHYRPTIATCPGEMSICINRGKEYPIGGYTYCSLTCPRFQETANGTKTVEIKIEIQPKKG